MTRFIVGRACICLAGLLPLAASAQAAAATTDGLGMIALVKVLFALGLVLAAIIAVAWLLRRVGPPQQAGRLMRVLASVAIGQRERLVLVEIGETWFVLGVAPGQITTVHTLAKQAGVFDAPPQDVGGWLRRTVQKRAP